MQQRGATSGSKALVHRLIDEVMNAGRLEVIDEIYTPALAPRARAWIGPFLTSFTDLEMRVVTLLAEDDMVVGRFTCAATHVGTWHGHAPTHRRFTDVAEVYFFRVRDGRLASAWGLEDTWEHAPARAGPLTPSRPVDRRNPPVT